MQITVELTDEARDEMRRIEIEDELSMQQQLQHGLTLLRLYLRARYQGRRLVIENVNGRDRELVELPTNQ